MWFSQTQEQTWKASIENAPTEIRERMLRINANLGTANMADTCKYVDDLVNYLYHYKRCLIGLKNLAESKKD